MNSTLVIMLVMAVLTLGSNFLSYTVGRSHGIENGKAQVEQQFAKYREKQERILQEEIAKNTSIREELTEQLSQQRTEHINEIQSINDRHAALIASVRNRADRSSAVTKSLNENSTITTTVEPRTVGTGAELSRQDAEFLIGEAAAADILRKALEMCIRSYDEVREAYNRQDGTYREPKD